MEMLDALSQTFDHTTKIVSGVRADQLDDQTPCSEWPLRTLLAHMTGVVVNMGLGASGKELLPSIEGFVIEPADLGAQFRSEADRTLAAWRSCSDGDEVNVGAGPMPAERRARLSTCSTRQRTRGTSPAARARTQTCRTLSRLPRSRAQTRSCPMRSAGSRVSLPPSRLPTDASPTDQLVAFLGRTP